MPALTTRLLLRIGVMLLVFLAFLAMAAGVLDAHLALRGHLAVRLDTLHLAGELLSVRELQVLVGVGLVLSCVLPVLGPVSGASLTLGAMLAIWAQGLSQARASSVLPMEYSLLTVLMLYLVNVLTGYFSEARARQRLASLFGQYVPPELVERLKEDPGSLRLDGESREMSILFCDVRGFTELAERLDPRQLVRMLNTIFDPVTEAVHRHLGTVDKYIGDAMMAFWGAPARDPRHASHAVAAALEIRDALVGLRADFASRGWPPIRMGIGVNSGLVSVGNMGSRYRVSYTVVGDAVNLASRLEAVTRFLSVDIVVSEPVREASEGILFRELGVVRVRGRQAPTRLFEPICREAVATPELTAFLARHQRALEAFQGGRWEEALRGFGRLWEEHPRERLYEVYLRNLGRLARAPVPADWAGELDVDERREASAAPAPAPSAPPELSTVEYLRGLSGTGV